MALGAKKDKCQALFYSLAFHEAIAIFIDLVGGKYREKGSWYRDSRNKECHRWQGELAVMRRWTAMTKEAHRGA